MNKIKILSPYFGKLPNYTKLWAESLKKNENIDFFLITNDTVDFELPSNLKVIKMSMSELYKLASDKLNIKKFFSPYKLCDFKPCYGKLFEDYITDASHWGYCDIDMIFGDISKFITQDMLDYYDKILDLGHFSIYKNEDRINLMFRNELLGWNIFNGVKKSKSIKIFDERLFLGRGGINGLFVENGYNLYIDRTIFSDIKPDYISFYDVNLKYRNNTYYFHSKDSLYCISNNDGVEYKEEILYVHFQKREMNIKSFKNNNNFYYTDFGVVENKLDSMTLFDMGKSHYFFINKDRKLREKRINQLKDLVNFILPI